MLNILPPDEYFKSLPRKVVSSAVLFTDKHSRLMIVNLTYKNHWGVPGGIVDENESPKQAAIREIKEELGLDLKNLRLLAVDYVSGEAEKRERIQFVFGGGVLDKTEISKVKLQEEELSEYQFADTKGLEKLLSRVTAKRVLACLRNQDKGVLYLENGEIALP